ncbi:niacin transporter NiaP-like, partial [Convolutriloba macropyga]|uniref:niacin transporter NiaP-like n=1 Tax=Convolutriloba macropyga TaxID=536237 RepID=UPI003F521F93
MDSDMQVTELVDTLGFGRYQILLLLLCSGGYFAVCADLLIIVYQESSLEATFSIDNTQFAFIPLASTISSNIGSLTFGYLADSIGRRVPFVVSALFSSLSGVISVLSESYWFFLTTRVLVGFGLGGLSSIDFVVFNELCPRNVRGRATLVITIFGALGVLFIAGINLISWSTVLPGIDQWRIIGIIGAFPMLFVLIARMLFFDESPKYLVSKGRTEEATAVLTKIARQNLIDSEENIQNTVSQLLDGFEDNTPAIDADRNERSNWPAKCSTATGNVIRQYINVIKFDPKLTLSLLIAWTCQGVSYWGLTLFLPEYLTSKTSISANLTIFLMVACEIPGLLLAFVLIDTGVVGRLNLMRGLFLMSAICSLITAFLSHQSTIIVVFCCLIYFFMIPNWGVLFTFSAEEYPTEIRTSASGFFQVFSSITGLFSPFLSGALVNKADDSASNNVDYYMIVWSCFLLAGFLSVIVMRK